METKKIIQALKCCHNLDECEDCEYNESGEFCEELLKRDAAKRLEELEAELEKRTINDRPYEWISVEDKPLPKLSDEINIEVWPCYPKDLPAYIAFFGNGARNGATHWMRLEPPKPKATTFKDVFLKAFPKAPIDEDGIPKACIADVFPWAKHKHCDGWMCFEDWSQPYFEEEEKE